MSALSRIREFCEKIINWTCLEKLRLRKLVIFLLIFDFFSSILILIPTIAVLFVYVWPGGRAGFVDGKWLNHTDVFKFRRQQPWELNDPIDWDEGDRVYINKTRQELDKICSSYDSGIAIPGDPGDYLKEVVGYPNRSGYNDIMKTVLQLWAASISIIYFSCPLLLLALWWKKQATTLISIYVFIQLFPMCILIAATQIAQDKIMCAVDIIYGHQPIRMYLILFTIFFWIYKLLEFTIFVLYTMEQSISKKRKGYGFRRRRYRRRQVGPESSHAPKENLEEEVYKPAPEDDGVDVEKIMAKERKSFVQKNTGKSLAREILELGDTTDDDNYYDKNKHKQEKRMYGAKANTSTKVSFS